MSDLNHLLVVDDQPEICTILQEYLSAHGYRVSVAHNGTEMRRTLEESSVGIILLDLVMPDEDGLVLTRWLRQRSSDIGVIMLTGRGEPVDRIIGLEIGADDYLSKPFHLREVLARINSLGRRLAMRRQHVKQEERRYFRFAGWTLNLSSHELISPNGEQVPLTSGEFDLLHAFLTHPREVLSRERLLDTAGARDDGVFDRTIDVRIGRLRRKLQDDRGQPQLIKTVRNGGYILAATIETAPTTAPAVPALLPADAVEVRQP